MSAIATSREKVARSSSPAPRDRRATLVAVPRHCHSMKAAADGSGAERSCKSQWSLFAALKGILSWAADVDVDGGRLDS